MGLLGRAFDREGSSQSQLRFPAWAEKIQADLSRNGYNDFVGYSDGCILGEISRFYGIVIRMFGGEKHHPHFHAIYGDYSALVDIRSLKLVAGDLPGRAKHLIMEWASEHQAELLRNWESLQEGRVPRKIPPLE